MATRGGFIIGTIVGEIVGQPYIGKPKAGADGPPEFTLVRLLVRRFSSNGPKHMWISCLFFGKAAQTIQKWGTPGTRLFVHGRLSQSQWVDKNKVHHLDYRVAVNEFQFLDRTPYNRDATDSAVESSVDTRKVARVPRYQGTFR